MFRYLAIACLAAAAVGEPDAKAEADPALLYGGYGLHGLGYGHYYGKREAEAEPEAEAEADPALLYSTYGYGLGHYGYAGLGHYGYAGLGHYGYAGLGYGYGL